LSDWKLTESRIKKWKEAAMEMEKRRIEWALTSKDQSLD